MCCKKFLRNLQTQRKMIPFLFQINNTTCNLIPGLQFFFFRLDSVKTPQEKVHYGHKKNGLTPAVVFLFLDKGGGKTFPSFFTHPKMPWATCKLLSIGTKTQKTAQGSLCNTLFFSGQIDANFHVQYKSLRIVLYENACTVYCKILA